MSAALNSVVRGSCDAAVLESAKRGDVSDLTQLISRINHTDKSALIEARDSEYGLTPLRYPIAPGALLTGLWQHVTELCINGSWAASYGHLGAVQLLKRTARVNERCTTMGKTALVWAIAEVQIYAEH